MIVSAFPRYNLRNIPEALRQVANRIEHGELSAIRCVLVLEPEGDVEGVSYMAFGAEPFTRAHAVGILVAAEREIL